MPVADLFQLLMEKLGVSGINIVRGQVNTPAKPPC
jgi:hypothetical protein